MSAQILPKPESQVAFLDVYSPNSVPLQMCMNFLYMLMKERSDEDDPHVNISHRALPTYEQHCAFVATHPYRGWYIPIDMHCRGEACMMGSVNMTKQNEVGIVLLRARRGQGWGKKVLQHLFERYDPLPEQPGVRRGCWLANINPSNARSIALFQKFGARHIQNTYEIDTGKITL